MIATVTNSTIVISSPTQELVSFLDESLSYVDKAKQYQMRRMSRNVWSRGSQLYKDLKNQVKGTLLVKLDNGDVEFPSGFFYLLEGRNLTINDQRKDTGPTISLPWVTRPDPTRPYQDEALTLAVANKRGLLELATGLGKSLIAIYLIRALKKKTLIVCPSESVASQFYDLAVKAFGANQVGFYGSGKKKIANITIGIAASVTRNTDAFVKADLGLVIVDEVHHLSANTFFNIATALSGVGRIYGLTATNYRSDGKDIMIAAGCGQALIVRDAKWGIQNGWLAKPVFMVHRVKTGGRNYRDDKLKNYKEHVLNNKIMKTRILSDIQALIKQGLSVLCLVDEVAHGIELAGQLGVPFATGEDKKSQSYVDQLNAGKIPCLVATDGKVGEGSDTRNVDALVLANFVASKGPVMQAVGRGLRKQGTKTKCLVIDYVPEGSDMLTRHAMQRVGYYEELETSVTII